MREGSKLNSRFVTLRRFVGLSCNQSCSPSEKSRNRIRYRSLPVTVDRVLESDVTDEQRDYCNGKYNQHRQSWNKSSATFCGDRIDCDGKQGEWIHYVNDACNGSRTFWQRAYRDTETARETSLPHSRLRGDSIVDMMTNLLGESTLVRTWGYGAASKHGWCYVYSYLL